MTSSCIDIHRKQKFLLEIDAEKKNTNLLQNANEQKKPILEKEQNMVEQGRIHGYPSRVRVDRGCVLGHYGAFGQEQ